MLCLSAKEFQFPWKHPAFQTEQKSEHLKDNVFFSVHCDEGSNGRRKISCARDSEIRVWSVGGRRRM